MPYNISGEIMVVPSAPLFPSFHIMKRILSRHGIYLGHRLTVLWRSWGSCSIFLGAVLRLVDVVVVVVIPVIVSCLRSTYCWLLTTTDARSKSTLAIGGNAGCDGIE